jgi:hypothetical protein
MEINYKYHMGFFEIKIRISSRQMGLEFLMKSEKTRGSGG